jgi:hypothetical protein
MDFQLKVAERWLERAEKSLDDYAKFLFYFSGFALFYLWSRINHVEGDANEIKNLLGKFDEATARSILDQVHLSVLYFCHRGPVPRMQERTCSNPTPVSVAEGERLRRELGNEGKTAKERLVALAQVIYIVRCNLVHGSRVPGDDPVTTGTCLEPLRLILKESIEYTRKTSTQP